TVTVMWWVWTSSRWYGSGTSSAGMVAAAGMSGESGNGRYRWSTVGTVDSTKGPSAGKAAGWRGIPRRTGRLTRTWRTPSASAGVATTTTPALALGVRRDHRPNSTNWVTPGAGRSGVSSTVA